MSWNWIFTNWANSKLSSKEARFPVSFVLRSCRADLSVGVASLFPVESAPSSRRSRCGSSRRKRSQRGPTEVPGPSNRSHASLDAFSYILERLRPKDSSRIGRNRWVKECVILQVSSFDTQSHKEAYSTRLLVEVKNYSIATLGHAICYLYSLDMIQTAYLTQIMFQVKEWLREWPPNASHSQPSFTLIWPSSITLAAVAIQ